jgi:NAD(P)-dependent dehydrogenase (short-subunit alcohol dehydrogenase family)
MNLQGSVAYVIGATGGLGAPISRFLGEHGARVGAFFREKQDRADSLLESLEGAGVDARGYRIDVSKSDSVDAAIAKATAELGPPDILINSAGLSRNSVTWKTRDEDWKTSLDVNLNGVFHCMRAVLPSMRERGRGRIVNIASIVGQVGIAGTAAYAASKAGISGLTRATAVEVAKRNITVNALALGYFDAGIIADVPPDLLAGIVGTIPVGRLGRTEELCHTIGFLCSEHAAYITGQTINVNGGLYLG